MIALWLLALFGCGHQSCVDETGYEDCPTDGTVDPGGPDAASDDAAPALWYSARDVLDDTPQDVTVLATAGLFPAATTVVLTVADDAAPPVAVVDGGFVATVTAALGDTVQIAPDRGAAAQLVLDDDLSSVFSDAPGEVGGPDAPSAPDVVDGEVDVGDGALAWASAPYLAWVEGRSAVVRVGVGESASLPGAVGETLCVANVSGERASIEVCTRLPRDPLRP